MLHPQSQRDNIVKSHLAGKSFVWRHKENALLTCQICLNSLFSEIEYDLDIHLLLPLEIFFVY